MPGVSGLFKPLVDAIGDTLGSIMTGDKITKAAARKSKATTSDVLLAFDDSGSTGGCKMYWNYMQRIYSDLQRESQRIIYLEWNSSAKEVTAAQLQGFIKDRRGTGGTDPGLVASYIMRNNFHGRLVLVTDGQCTPDTANAIMGLDHEFEFVDVYLINEYSNSANMSVSSPFTRASPHNVKVINSGGDVAETITLTQEDMELTDHLITIGTYEEFLRNYDTLEKVVTARTMGLGAQKVLREKLLEMQKRLVREQSIRESNDKEERDILTQALQEGNHTAALEAACDVIKMHDRAGLSDMQKKMSFLLKCTEGALQRTFTTQQIASQRATYAPVAAVTPAETAVPVIDTSIRLPEWTCPLTLEVEQNGNVCFLVRQGDPLLVGVDKKMVDAIINNPLILLTQPFTEIRKSFLGRIGHPISLEALHDGSEASGRFPFATDPLDREPLVPVAICLGAAKDHAKATDSALRAIVSNGQILGNVDLIFAVLAKAIERGEVSWATQHSAMFLNHLVWRLQNRRTFASLSGLPSTINRMMPLGTACWFVHETAFLASTLVPGEEPIRMHMAYTDHLKWLASLLGYPIEEDINRLYITCLAVMLQLRRKAVVGTTSIADLCSRAKALYQASVTISQDNINERVLELEKFCQYIPVDGSACDIQIQQIRKWTTSFTNIKGSEKIPIGVLYTILTNTSLSSSAGDHRVNITGGHDLTKTPDTTWRLQQQPQKLFEPQIIPDTCRPLYNGGRWEADAMAYYHTDSVRDIFPATKYYMEFVKKYEMWPTFDEFALFTYHRLCIGEGARFATLPADLKDWFEVNHKAYTNIRNSLTATEAAQRYSKSCFLVVREAIEREAGVGEYTQDI